MMKKNLILCVLTWSAISFVGANENALLATSTNTPLACKCQEKPKNEETLACKCQEKPKDTETLACKCKHKQNEDTRFNNNNTPV